MATKNTFSELYVTTQGDSRHLVLDMGEAGIKYADYVDTYIVNCCLDIYGYPEPDGSEADNSDVDERIYSGDYSDLIKVGELLGRLILFEQMQNDGYDPYMVCDDCDADLEYVMATLKRTVVSGYQ